MRGFGESCFGNFLFGFLRVGCAGHFRIFDGFYLDFFSFFV